MTDGLLMGAVLGFRHAEGFSFPVGYAVGLLTFGDEENSANLIIGPKWYEQPAVAWLNYRMAF